MVLVGNALMSGAFRVCIRAQGAKRVTHFQPGNQTFQLCSADSRVTKACDEVYVNDFGLAQNLAYLGQESKVRVLRSWRRKLTAARDVLIDDDCEARCVAA